MLDTLSRIWQSAYYVENPPEEKRSFRLVSVGACLCYQKSNFLLIKIGEISVPGIGKPRLRLKDGVVISFTHAAMDEFNIEDVESVSPYDDALRIAVFEDTDGNPLCGLANFGCHNALRDC